MNTTLLYTLGFIIGVLGTSFLLYYLKTRKLLHAQHKLILDFTMILASMSKEIADLKDKKTYTEPARQEPGNCKETTSDANN